MSTHNICFCREIRKVDTVWLKKVPYQELCGGIKMFFDELI